MFVKFRRRLLIAPATAALIIVACSGGDNPSSGIDTPAPTETTSPAPLGTPASAATATTTADTPTISASSPEAASPTRGCFGHCSGGPVDTPTPTTIGADGVPRVPRLRRLTFSPGEELMASDLAQRGHGRPGTGPFPGVTLVIGSIGVDAITETQVVPMSGVMPEPSNMAVVAWYDFSSWPGLGGAPLTGGNAVLAGNLGSDALHGVFWDLRNLVPGDIITLGLGDGRQLFYRVEFNKTVSVGGDWSETVAATTDESMSLVTSAGDLVGGHYTHRRIAWARRVNCTPLAGQASARAPQVECELPE